MRWRKAHRNNLRSLGRSVRRPLLSPGWRDWIETILPDLVFTQFINGNSIFNRLMQARQYSTYETIMLPMRQTSGSYQTAEGAPIFPTSPNRLQVIWRNIWIAQGHKCADCGESVELQDSIKRSHSFTIICQKCYAKHPPLVVIVDDIDFSKPTI